MQIEDLNLKLTPTKKQLIKNTFRIGEIVNAKVIQKRGSHTYTLDIKGNIFEATSKIQINSGKLKLYVKKLNPQIILKIIDDNQNIVGKDLIKTTTLITKNPLNLKVKILESHLILESLPTESVDFIKLPIKLDLNSYTKTINQVKNSILKALMEDNLKSMLTNLAKLLNITNDINLKENIKNIEEKLLKEKKIDKSTIDTLISKIDNISKRSSSNEEKFINSIKSLLKHIPLSDKQFQNIFFQIPLLVEGRKEKLFIKKEAVKNSKDRKIFKISLNIKSSAYGLIKINGLYINNSTSCNIAFTNKNALEKFKKKEDKLRKILGNVNLYITLIDEKPFFIQKHLNLKI